MLKKIITLSLLLINTIAFAAVTASIDRNRISSNESFMLYITSDSVFKEMNPQLAPLNKNFEVVGSSNSSQVSIINGKHTSKQQVMVTLMPRHSGRLLIPALKIGNEKTQPIYVTVLPASAIPKSQQKVFVETSLSPQDTYPKAENIFTVKLYYSLDNLAGHLSPPSANGLRFASLGKATEYGVKRGNKAFRVVERRYAVFAKAPGSYKIPAIIFTGAAESQHNMNDLFQLTGGKPVRAISKPITLHVAKAPVNLAHWLPSSQLQLTENWNSNPPVFKVGSPVTRTIILSAQGITANQLPDITEPTMNGINSYPGQPVLQTVSNGNSIVGTKTVKIAYIPTQAGNMTFPAIKIRWWNTQSKQFKTSQLPARTFAIQPGKASAMPIQAEPAPIQKPVATSSHYNIWAWIAGLFFLAWLVTLYFWWGRKRKPSPHDIERQQSARRIRDNVKRACHSNNAEAIKKTLISWSNAKWPEKTIQTLGEIAKQTIHPDFQQAIRELDESLYHNHESMTDGEKIWQAFMTHEKNKAKATKSRVRPLPPLHPGE